MSQDRKPSPEPEFGARLARLEKIVSGLAKSRSVDDIFGHGFEAVSGHLGTLNSRLEELAAELTPLRRLSGPSVPFSDEQRAHLDALLAAHDRPDLKGTNYLTSNDGGLRFIGDPLPAPNAPRKQSGKRSAKP